MRSIGAEWKKLKTPFGYYLLVLHNVFFFYFCCFFFFFKLPVSSNRIRPRSRLRRLCNGTPTTNHRSHRLLDIQRSTLLELSYPAVAQATLRKQKKQIATRLL